MNDEVMNTAAQKIIEYSLLVFLLVAGIVFLGRAIWKILKDASTDQKESRDVLITLSKNSTEALANNTNAMENNTQAVNELRLAIQEEFEDLHKVIEKEHGQTNTFLQNLDSKLNKLITQTAK